jgi:hypothetical protein
MKFSTSALLLGASACLTATTDAFAFVGRQSNFGSTSTLRTTSRSSSSSSSRSSLNMVADDAKVILVTGSSRGLGKSIALELAKSGQKLVINYVSDGSKSSAEATVEEVKALGGDAIAVQADSTLSSVGFSWCCVAPRVDFVDFWFPLFKTQSHFVCLLLLCQLLIQSPFKRCLRKSWKNTARSTS